MVQIHHVTCLSINIRMIYGVMMILYQQAYNWLYKVNNEYYL